LIRKLEVTFRSIPRPPFVDANGKEAVDAVFSIPGIKRNLSFEKLRKSFKAGKECYRKGNFAIKAKFKDCRRYFKLMTTEQFKSAGINLLKDWEDLTEYTLEDTFSCTAYAAISRRSSSSNINLPMYATNAKLIISNIDPTTGRAKGVPKFFIFTLWNEEEPRDFNTFFNQV